MFRIEFCGSYIVLSELPTVKNGLVIIDKEILTACQNISDVITMGGCKEQAKKFLESCGK
jgi:hypothetical protein